MSKKLLSVAVGVCLMASVFMAPSAGASVREDRLFYSLVTKDAPTLKAISRKELVKTAKETCKFLRNGFTIMDAYDVMEESGFTETEISSFLAGAVVFYCPDQEDNF